MLRPPKIVAVASGGGHLTELLLSLPEEFLTSTTFVTFKTAHTKKTLKSYKHCFIIDPHVSRIKYMYNFVQSLKIFFRINPAVVVTTGAGIAVSLIILARIFNKRLIYIETGARVTGLSRSGKFAYRFADLFIVQSTYLNDTLPKSVLGQL